MVLGVRAQLTTLPSSRRISALVVLPNDRSKCSLCSLAFFSYRFAQAVPGVRITTMRLAQSMLPKPTWTKRYWLVPIVFTSILIPVVGIVVGAARLELARLPAEVLETSVSANSTMLPHAAGIAAGRRESHDHFVAGDPKVAGVVAGTRLAVHIGVGGLAFP